MFQTPGSIEDKCLPNKPMMEARSTERSPEQDAAIAILTHFLLVPQAQERRRPLLAKYERQCHLICTNALTLMHLLCAHNTVDATERLQLQ